MAAVQSNSATSNQTSKDPELWYKNPMVLLNDYDQFFPTNNLSRAGKINAVARFGIYYLILLILFSKDAKWIAISVIVLGISYYLGVSEGFVSLDNDIDGKACQPPTKYNPFMNYTVGDMIKGVDRMPACKYEDVKKKMRYDYKSKFPSDSNDMWGKYASDRQFYTMPNTNIVNDQNGFATACFGDSGECKSTGQNCLKVNDIMYHTARLQSPNELLN